MVNDLERRAADVASAKAATIRGLRDLFGALSEDLGGFRELIEPAAVDRTLAEPIDVRALVDHDPGKMIGRVKAGTLRLRKGRRRAARRDRPCRRDNDVWAGTCSTLVRRGDVTGMSIAFDVMPGGERFERRDGGLVRIMTDTRRIETSVVTFPA